MRRSGATRLFDAPCWRGTDAIFPEALATVEMFREFEMFMPGAPLFANMSEFDCPLISCLGGRLHRLLRLHR